MHKAVESFQEDLHKVIRRATKSKAYNAPIDEVADHFSDLFEEELAKAFDENVAEKNARTRIGSVYAIAFQILSTPERVTKGMRVQIVALAFPFLAAIVYCAHAFSYASPVFEFIQRNLTQPIVYGYVFAGLAFGYAVMMARKVAWKPFVASTALLFVAGVPAINYLLKPELLFGMEKSEAKLLLGKQTSIESNLNRVEAAINSIYYAKGLSAKAADGPISALAAVLESASLESFSIDAKRGGQYLYPSRIEYTQDRLSYYAVRFARTNDLDLAKRKWESGLEINQQIPLVMKARSQNVAAFQGFLTTKPVLWTYGVGISFALMGMMTLPFLGLGLVGYLVARIQILRTAWFRFGRT
jgi:hypothetical protein